MRIAHLYRYYAPHPGGVERSMHELATLMRRDGHDVRAMVCAPGLRSRRRAHDGIEVLEIPSAGEVWSVPVAPAYVFAPSREGELWHLHEAFPPGTLAAWLRARGATRRPLVVTWHLEVTRQRALRPIHDALARRVLADADVVHVTTQQLADSSRVIAHARSKLRVIPHIVDASRLRGGSGRVATELRDWAGEDLLALFVGRLVPYKGVAVLLDALREVRGVRAAIVGDGPLAAELRARSERAGLADRVRWLGALSDPDLGDAYSAAGALVLPSVSRTETFGVVQVEAMAFGVPVISTRLGTGVEEVNQDGVSGLTVAPRDARALAEALGALARDGALRRRLAAGARARARDFAPERLAQAYREMYAAAFR